MLPSVVAHESGDGVSIAHCPFCGSGQVVGRSDGNAECQFCNQSFLVRVQPMYSAFPQSVDGMPVQIPGMPPPAPAPGMDPGADPNAAPQDDSSMPPGAGGAAAPAGDSAGGNAPPPFGGGGSGGAPPPDGSSGSDSSDDDKKKDSGGGPPFGKKKSYRTAVGCRLGRAAYVDYLATTLGGPR